MTISIEHNLKFVTELDETNPVSQRLLALPNELRMAMLESMLKDLLTPAIEPALEYINKGNSYALLKLAK